MNCKVINIDKQYEPLLPFLYPTYSIVESSWLSSNFITHRDIKSASERDALNVRYENCIFISHQLFDELWDEERLKKECIEFSRKNLKNRKTKFEPSKTAFVSDCVNFIFQNFLVEEEEINQLFDSFGSSLFVKNFITLSNKVPVQVLITSITTFINRILNDDSSLYYKKKSILFKNKIQNNFEKAVDDYLLRDKDNFGLSFVKFVIDLVC